MEGELQYLAVTSKLPKAFTAKFHGVEYLFKPGRSVNMPVDAAKHIFGFGDDDKTRSLHRLGWLTLSNDMEGALEKLEQITFLPIEQVFELRGQRRRRPRISNDRSPVNAGDPNGDGAPSPNESDDEDEDETQEAAQDS